MQAGFAEAKGHMDVVVSQLGQIPGGRDPRNRGVVGLHGKGGRFQRLGSDLGL